MEEGKVSTTDTAEAVGAEAEPQKETLDSAFEGDEPSGEQAGSEQSEQAGSGTPPEIDWASHGLPELSGKDAEYVKNFFSYRNRTYGNQANELGELRSWKEKYAGVIEKMGEATGQPAQAVQAAKAKMSDVELRLFAEAFNEDPYAAMDKFVLPRMRDSIKEEILNSLDEKIKPTLEKQAKDLTDEQEWNAFRDATPGFEEFVPVMQQLMTPQYLGDGVPYKEVHKLAVLAKEEPTLFPVTCELMQKGVGFDQSKEYATLKQNAPVDAEKKIQQVKGEVKKAAAGAKRGTAAAASKSSDITDMDSAFEMED
jgi:hypothetical protein